MTLAATWLRRLRESLRRSPVAAADEAPRRPDSAENAASPEHVRTLDRLRALVVEQSDARLSPQDVVATDDLFDCGHLDSMSAVALLEFIDERYGVRIDQAELVGRLSTLDALVRYVVAEARDERTEL